MNEIGSLRLADAQIVRLEDQGPTLRVSYLDWREQERSIVFDGVVSYQSFSAMRRDLSHAIALLEADRIADACKRADEENTDGYTLYAFIDAWGDQRVLEVIAKDFRLEGPEEA